MLGRFLIFIDNIFSYTNFKLFLIDNYNVLFEESDFLLLYLVTFLIFFIFVVVLFLSLIYIFKSLNNRAKRRF